MEGRWKALGNKIWQARYIYLLLLPAVIFFLVFDYGPMYGLLLAFKKYNARLGILRSEWVGLSNFRRIFITPQAVNALINTFVISLSRLIFQFPVPILLALLINEMPGKKLKRIYQTIYTFPHFLNWVVVASILVNFLSTTGTVNTILSNLGMGKINFLSNPKTFRGLLYLTASWKEMGWSSIIYIAAIAGIDPTLYEAATVDGAGRYRKIIHVTLPGITSTIIVLFILATGRIMNAGFEQIFNLQNPAVQNVSDIIDTYVYTITFKGTPSYGFSTAVGMFKSVTNCLLLIIADRVVRFMSGRGLFQ